jgi:hypothetical protein
MADVRPAATDGDHALLQRLLRPAGPDSGRSLLSTISDTDYSLSSPPDFLAVRSGPKVTGQFSGGGTTFQVVDTEGTNITYFAAGSPPTAYKGVAIKFGPETSPAQRERQTRFAMSYLADHLDDREAPGGGWNRSLFDASL